MSVDSIGLRGRLHSAWLVVRYPLRQPSFWVLISGYAALLLWWRFGNPQGHAAAHGHDHGGPPFDPEWPRWLVYGWLLLEVRRRSPVVHPLEPRAQRRVLSWYGVRLILESILVWFTAEAIGALCSAAFHVEPAELFVNAALTVSAAIVVAAIRIAGFRESFARALWMFVALTLLVVELLLSHGEPMPSAIGISCLAVAFAHFTGQVRSRRTSEVSG